MTTWTPIGETPFILVFWTKVVIPAKVGLTSFKVDHKNEEKNDKELRLNLNLLDEVRIGIEQRLALYQSLIVRHYNKRAKPRHLDIGELVLRRVTLATRDSAHGKLVQTGRTLQGHRLLQERYLPPKDFLWEKATSYLECWALKGVPLVVRFLQLCLYLLYLHFLSIHCL